MDKLTEAIVIIFTGIIGIAIVAVLVSKNANTSGVISAISKGFAGDLAAAVSPVTGAGNSGLGSIFANMGQGMGE